MDRGKCPSFHAAVELIGRRWNGVIIDMLLGSPLRFHELRAAIPDITPAMLSQRLKELEAEGLLRREVSATRPIEVSYSLTGTGHQLSAVLDAVAVWSVEWSGDIADPGAAVGSAGNGDNRRDNREGSRWNSASIRSAN